MLRKPPPFKPVEEETRFETICRLARELDVEGLIEIKNQDGSFLRIKQEERTPQTLLAMEGNVDAVNMLIYVFEASSSDVVYGYAAVGLVNKVNEMMAVGRYSDFDNLREFIDYLDHHLYIYNGWQEAIKGYVHGGFDTYVEDVLLEKPNLLNDAVNEYVKIGSWDKVEELLARGGKLDPACIPEDVLQDESLKFRLMSIVNNEETRRQILMKSNPPFADDEFAFIHPIKKAARMNRVMREYNLSFHQALPLHEFQEKNQLQGVRTWLLEGLLTTQPRKENMPAKSYDEAVTVLPLLSRDIFLEISSMLVGLPVDDTRKILVGVHMQLFAGVAKENAKKYALGLFTPAKYMSEQIKDMDHYDHKRRRIE